MKRIFISILLVPLLVMLSCEQEPMLTVSGNSFSFKEDGGVATLTITTNNPWRASSSQSWCKLSTTSGEVTELSSASISIMCEGNQSYEPRSCTITISSAELQEVITVEQTDNKGILVTPTKVEVTNSASTIELDVRHNVDFSVTSNVSWIKQVSSKSLTDSKLYFLVEANTSYDNREGTITLTQKNGTMKQEVKVYQSQENAIIISSKKYDISSTMQTVEVAIKSNVKYEVSIPDDAKPWVSYIGTKALAEAIVLLEVKRNETYDARSATITIKDQNSSLKDEIVINQAARDGLILSEKEFNLESSGGNISVVVSSNVDYTITPSERWISVVTTKGLTDNTHTLNVQKNEGFSDRSAFVVFKAKNVPALADTVFVNQRRNEYLKLEQTSYEMYPEGGTIDVAVKTNVDYVISIPTDANGWLSVASQANDGFQLTFTENEDDSRETVISLKWTKESVEQVTKLKIIQQEFGPVTVSLSHAGELPELIPNERKDKIRKLIIEGDINGTDVLYFRGMKSLISIDLTDARIVEGGEPFIKYGESVNGYTYPDGHGIGRWAIADRSTMNDRLDYVFWGMSIIEEIFLPKTLLNIGSDSFYGCRNLKTITIPKSVQPSYVDPSAFFSCISLTEILVEDGNGVLFSEDGCLFSRSGEIITLLAIPAGKKSCTIPSYVDQLHSYTMPEGSQLQELTLLSHSPKLIPYFFDKLCLLERFNVSSENDFYVDVDGVLYSKDLKTIVCYPSGRTDETYSILNTVTNVGPGCFNTSMYIKTMTLPEGITELGYSSFFDCRHMESISFPSTLESINTSAFQHCYLLKTIICLSVTPPVVADDYVFYDVNPDQVLVPSESVDAYKGASVWSAYASVIKALE